MNFLEILIISCILGAKIKGLFPVFFSQQKSIRSIIKRTNHGDSTLDPMIFGVSLLHVQLNVEHEICGMTGSREDTLSDNSFVHRTSVGVSWRNQILVVRNQVQKWHFGEQLLVIRLLEHLLFSIPATALNIETVDVSTVVCRFARVSRLWI